MRVLDAFDVIQNQSKFQVVTRASLHKEPGSVAQYLRIQGAVWSTAVGVERVDGSLRRATHEAQRALSQSRWLRLSTVVRVLETQYIGCTGIRTTCVKQKKTLLTTHVITM